MIGSHGSTSSEREVFSNAQKFVLSEVRVVQVLLLRRWFE